MRARARPGPGARRTPKEELCRSRRNVREGRAESRRGEAGARERGAAAAEWAAAAAAEEAAAREEAEGDARAGGGGGCGCDSALGVRAAVNLGAAFGVTEPADGERQPPLPGPASAAARGAAELGPSPGRPAGRG